MNDGKFLKFLVNDITRLKNLNKSGKRKIKKYKCSECNILVSDDIKTIIKNKPMYFCSIECFEKKNI